MIEIEIFLNDFWTICNTRFARFIAKLDILTNFPWLFLGHFVFSSLFFHVQVSEDEWRQEVKRVNGLVPLNFIGPINYSFLLSSQFITVPL